jgi:microcystin-dependent protein
MAVPYIFSTVRSGSGLPLAWIDDNFAYITNGNPVFTNLTLSGNLSVNGTSTFNGMSTFNGGITIGSPITIGATTVNPTGITGSGLMVFNTSPTIVTANLVTPTLGTPASGNLANCTNLPISTGVSGLGAGVATALSYPPDAPGGFVTYSSNTTVPTGAVFWFAAATAPAGYLICDGSAQSTATYPDLFAVTGYTFGGAGATFNVPYLTDGSFIRGVGGNSAALGVKQSEAFGSHNHGVTDPGHNHTTNDPGHSHSVNDPGHNHTVNDPGHNHSHTDPGHNHTTNDPGHNHGLTDPGHNHDVFAGITGGVYPTGSYMLASGGTVYNTTSTSTTGISIAGAFTGVTNNANVTGVVNNANTTGVTNNSNTTGVSNVANITGVSNNSNTTGISTQNAGAAETRPLNMALLPCIKY